MTNRKLNVRELALNLIERIEKDSSFSHLIISQAIEKERVNEKDANLLTEIVYGTIDRKITLQYYLTPFLVAKKQPEHWVLLLLKMSIYQMVFLDKLPTYAVINEAVEIAKKKGHKGIASFVNGVLRNFSRKGPVDLASIEDPVIRLSVQTSHPDWLVRRWIHHYGEEVTEKMCRANITKKPMTVRVNTLKKSRQDVIEELEAKGLTVEPSALIKDAIIIHYGNVLKTKLIEEGIITIQDQSSMFATLALEVERGMKVLDTCSAPGGKATYIGELMHNEGEIFAHDLHANKIKLIRNNAKRLGLSNIEATKQDARKLRELYTNESFDRILVDAPCTGYGVIRSKPDIKYRKQLQDSEKLQLIQLEILQEVAPLLKINGKLVYSTCTVEKLENEDVVRTFIEKNPNYIVDLQFLNEAKALLNDAHISSYGVQIFPQTLNSDGFFICRLIKLAN